MKICDVQIPLCMTEYNSPLSSSKNEFLYSGFLFLHYMGIELLVKNIHVILEPYKGDWNSLNWFLLFHFLLLS
jgi:hypothetical protein